MKNLFIVLLACTVASCGHNSFKTEGGTVVTYHRKENGNLPVDSLVGLFSIKYTTEEGKLMMESDADNPIALKINTVDAPDQGELYRVLVKLKTGDSVSCEVPAQDLFEKTFKTGLPDSIAAENKIQFQIGFLEQVTEKEYYSRLEAKATKVEQKQLAIDAEILNEFFTSNNIETQTTDSGLRYIITKEGKGEKPQNDQVVLVNYAGRVFEGAYFDTSIEAVAKEQELYNPERPYEPLSFPLGQGRVIKGWDEGIALLNVGTEATFYIPSSLAYGTRSAAGGVIAPNSILVFDVELVGISK